MRITLVIKNSDHKNHSVANGLTDPRNTSSNHNLYTIEVVTDLHPTKSKLWSETAGIKYLNWSKARGQSDHVRDLTIKEVAVALLHSKWNIDLYPPECKYPPSNSLISRAWVIWRPSMALLSRSDAKKHSSHRRRHISPLRKNISIIAFEFTEVTSFYTCKWSCRTESKILEGP